MSSNKRLTFRMKNVTNCSYQGGKSRYPRDLVDLDNNLQQSDEAFGTFIKLVVDVDD